MSRDPEDYPLFIAINNGDVEYWEEFFEQFGLPTSFERQRREEIDGPLQVVLDPRPGFEATWVEGYSVISREETIAYMREHYAQFQSALSLFDRMYDDLDLEVAYRDSERVRS